MNLFDVFIWAVILLVFWIVLDIIEITGLPGQIKDAAKGPLDSIVTLAVDLTATVILGELCFTAFRVKKLAAED